MAWLDAYLEAKGRGDEEINLVDIQGTIGASAQIGRTEALNEAVKVVGTAAEGTEGQEGYKAATTGSLTITDDAYTIQWKAKDTTTGVGTITITPKNNAANAKDFTVGLPICK